jgi:hypothetical protein
VERHSITGCSTKVERVDLEMAKIVDNMGNILEQRVPLSDAVDKVKSLYKGLGIDRRMTGIGIVSTTSVKTLSMDEMDFICDKYERFFHDRKFDKVQGAYVVTDEEMNNIRQNCTRFFIMND